MSNQKIKISMVALGCSKNLVDAECMLSLLRQNGFELVEDPASSNVVIINTCGFIESAKKEAIDAILNIADLKKPNGNVEYIASQVSYSYSPKLVTDGSTVSKPTTPTRTGYTFEGWFTSDGTEWDFSKPVTSDLTLTAKWKSNTTTTSNTTNKTSTTTSSDSGTGSVPKTGEELPPYELWFTMIIIGAALILLGVRNRKNISRS